MAAHDDRNEPFHAGERALQDRMGVREPIDALGRRLIRDAMPGQHRELFVRLPFLLIGSVDAVGQPHASALAGPPGFVSSPDARHVRVAALPDASDPLAASLRVGAAVGLLGIEPHTRRRNRLNGVVSELSADGFTVEAMQSYGNCPKYIQARRASWLGPGAVRRPRYERSRTLDDAAARAIAAADTFFIASAYPSEPGDSIPSHGVDVSHRGGKPGFVRVQRGTGAPDTLTVPDFAGNAMFNTLGNLAVNPRAGLLFIDYDQGHVLHVATDAEIVWGGPELASFAGAERLLRLRVRGQLWAYGALPLHWSEPELSPFLYETGVWPR